jgi:CheY-like chemotaxis protein
MNIDGAIIVIEDDKDDQDILAELFAEICTEKGYINKLIILEDSSKVFNYLKDNKVEPFIILSDINMPKLDGFALRNLIFNDPELSRICIPYIFLTTSGDNVRFIEKAYAMSVQGYFQKPTSYSDFKVLLSRLISYWKLSKTPPKY